MTKGAETLWALENGADEFDMVINVGLLKAREYQKFMMIYPSGRIGRRQNSQSHSRELLLTEEEKIAACVISREAGAAFVKTSTVFPQAVRR